jgi:hypothetical protein
MVGVEEDADLRVERRRLALARLDLAEADRPAARLPVRLVQAPVQRDGAGGADRLQAQRLLRRRERFLRRRARRAEQRADEKRRPTMRASIQRDTDLLRSGGRVVALW